ncbi:hypothetical protein ACPOL_2391 [Acidisarcina polymorpha]|uniref:Uncharacterized protein n=1 Tax=Acidisarcina polymorpha TaxID=2211140 RepID=A0A2Z5FXU7_9BACT|nr:hypothetical protein ACPOL_2391 [Acidisarcina polymorpha]
MRIWKRRAGVFDKVFPAYRFLFIVFCLLRIVLNKDFA